MITVLGKLSPQQFLTDYWQKKPLLVRNAFPDLELPFTPEELAGLACDSDAPSRIVLENTHPAGSMQKPWLTRHPPFSDEDFTSLPDTHWTLLVNDIERYVPELGNFIEPFRFIPDWRIDDVMVSFAADQGSVGPHVDEYDVFLIQGMGQRRWQIITRKDFNTETIPDISLSILAEFEADKEWLLNPGDMLYLPPNVPHYGVAEGDCMTFSVGFRAPDRKELIQAWVDSLDQDAPDKAWLNRRFQDSGRPLQTNPGEITSQDLETLSKMILDGIQRESAGIPVWLGKYLTETRGNGQLLSEPSSPGSTEQAIDVCKGCDYEREPWLRFAYFESGDKIDFFADGRHLVLPPELKPVVQRLCSDYFYTTDFVEEIFKNKQLGRLMTELIQEQAIYAAEE